jgi:hypothetical protein
VVTVRKSRCAIGGPSVACSFALLHRLCPARPKPGSCAIRSGDTHLVTLSENRSGKGSLIPRLAHTCKTAGTGVGDADGQSTETYHEDAHHRSGLRDRHCRMKIPGFTIEARSILRTFKVLSDGPPKAKRTHVMSRQRTAWPMTRRLLPAGRSDHDRRSSGLISVQGIACSTRAK